MGGAAISSFWACSTESRKSARTRNQPCEHARKKTNHCRSLFFFEQDIAVFRDAFDDAKGVCFMSGQSGRVYASQGGVAETQLRKLNGFKPELKCRAW